MMNKTTKFTIKDGTKFKSLADISFEKNNFAYALAYYADNELISDVHYQEQIYPNAKLPCLVNNQCYYLKNIIKKKPPQNLNYYLVEQYFIKYQLYCDSKRITHSDLDIIDYQVNENNLMYQAYEYLNDLPLKDQLTKPIVIDSPSFYSDKEFGFKAKRRIVYYLNNEVLKIQANVQKYLLLKDKYILLYIDQDGFFVEVFDFNQQSLLKIKLENYQPSFTAYSLIYYPEINSLLFTMNKKKDDYNHPKNLYLLKLESNSKPLPLINLNALDDGVAPEAYNLPSKALKTTQYLIYQNEVYFIASRKATTCLYKVPIGKNNSPILVDDSFNYINLYTDDKKLYGTTSKSNIYTTLIEVTNHKCLINPNLYLKNKEYAEVETINVANRQQANIQAFYYHPSSIKTKLPLIALIHGGPNGFYSGGFSYEAQLYVAQGYAVVLPNPRGGSGFGLKHGNMKHAFNKDALEDIEDVVYHLLNKYDYLDKNRVAIVGGSYGGYEAIYAATYSNLFKTAIALRPFISYQITGSCSGAAGSNPSNSKKKFSDYLKENNKASLTNYVEKIHMPLQIIHSKLDGNCLVEASIQLFSLLDFYHPEIKKRLCLYPNSNHGLLSYGPAYLVEQAYNDILEWLKDNL